MPRDIKFRGKRIDDGQWLYGGIDLMQGDATIFDCSDMLHSQVEVDEETVGEFSGIRGKKGNEIYEGDIVQCMNNRFLSPFTPNSEPFMAVVVFVEGLFAVKRIDTFDIDCLCNWSNDAEVIGNIYDNPELLEENKKLKAELCDKNI